MANKKRGEVEIKALGKTFILRFDTNAICSLEEDMGKSVAQIGQMFDDESAFSLNVMRTMLFHGLRDSLTDPNKRFVGQIIDDIGFAAAGEKLGEAFQAAFPDAEDDQDPPATAG